MTHKDENGGRLAKAVHGLRKQDPDPAYVIGLAEDLWRHYGSMTDKELNYVIDRLNAFGAGVGAGAGFGAAAARGGA